MSKSKEVVTTESTGGAMVGFTGELDFDPADIEIPRIGVAQPMSKMVSQEEKASAGDIINHTEQTVIAGKGESVKFIPLFSTKKWRVEERVGNSYEFKGFEPYTPDNANAPFEFERDGTMWKRDLILGFYILLVSDLESDGFAIPHMIQFTRTSMKAGKMIVSGMALDKMRGKPSASTIYEVRSTKKSNDFGTWYTPDVSKVGPTPEQYLTVAEGWYNNLKPNLANIKVDEG